MNRRLSGEGRAAAPYVAYGHVACPANRRQLHAGVVGGGRHDKQGGGADFLCLSADADPGAEARAAGPSGATISPVQYRTNGYGANTLTHLDGGTVHSHTTVTLHTPQ